MQLSSLPWRLTPWAVVLRADLAEGRERLPRHTLGWQIAGWAAEWLVGAEPSGAFVAEGRTWALFPDGQVVDLAAWDTRDDEPGPGDLASSGLRHGGRDEARSPGPGIGTCAEPVRSAT